MTCEKVECDKGNPGNVLLTSRKCLQYFYQCTLYNASQSQHDSQQTIDCNFLWFSVDLINWRYQWYSGSVKNSKCRISVNSFCGNWSFFEFVKCRQFPIVPAIIFLLCNENLNSFLTRLQKLFKVGNYSREKTIHGNKVIFLYLLSLCWK